MLIFVIFSLLIAILAVIFALQNATPVMVTFLFWEIQGSLALVLLVAFIAGAVMAYFASIPTAVKDKWSLRSQRKRLTELEASLTVHRSKLEEAQAQLAAQEAQAPVSSPASLPPPAESAAGAPTTLVSDPAHDNGQGSRPSTPTGSLGSGA